MATRQVWANNKSMSRRIGESTFANQLRVKLRRTIGESAKTISIHARAHLMLMIEFPNPKQN